VAVLLARWLFSGDPAAATLAGLGAMIGHCFPVWLGFKGGKGVATMLGIAFALDWRIGGAAAATWLVGTFSTRISSVGGMAGALAAPLAAFSLAKIAQEAPVMAVALAVMAGIVIWRHRANIARLRAGTEPRIGSKG
jgi:glycerol-3-phosphate acyltransferase PlsY